MTKKENRPKTVSVEGYTYIRDGKVIIVESHTRRKPKKVKK